MKRFIMAKALEWALIGGVTSIGFLKFWTYLHKGQEKSKLRAILGWQTGEVIKLQEVLNVDQVLNKKQCENLLRKLHKVVDNVNGMMRGTNKTSNLGLVVNELCDIVKRVGVLVEDCGKQEWCRAAAFQMNNREAFRELVYDLKCLWDAICEIYSPRCGESQYEVPSIDFNVATYDEIQADEECLEVRLQTVANDSEDYELANHLLRRVQYDLQRVKGAELDALEVSMDFTKPKFLGKIGSGAAGEVYKSSWLGLESATKVMNCLFLKEAGILASLSHPNIIKFFGCGIVDTKQYLVMEVMEMSLGGFLKKQKTPLPYIVAIDIMVQIAKGMCYLHDMYVAHLDLKPDNVLVSSLPIVGVEGSCGHVFVKLMDYDTSKVDVQSKPELQEHTIGTAKYRAPEMNKSDKKYPPLMACPFQADVWSFAMTCSEILSLKQPFLDAKNRKVILENIRNHVRPSLPINCKELTKLMEECWVEDPSQRPTFSNICERLTTLKKAFMIGAYGNDIPRFKKNWLIFQDMEMKLKASFHDINIGATKKAEPTPKSETVVGIGSNLTNVRNHMARVNILGLIGMGGVGKTTLAKVLFHDVKTTYSASCFIERLKSKSLHEILCEILQELGSLDKETKLDLVDAQEMIRELLASKKIILILDDPVDEAQIRDIIPIDVTCVNKNSNIIVTTCDRGVIEKFVEENGRIDVGKLDGNAAKKLFNYYVSSDEGQLSPQFFVIRDKIVGCCNGLPLSLKVMGAYLRGKDKIRSWERAFQRMRRGRSLDGDEGLWSTLRISFEGLKEEEKKLFMDLACFFPGGCQKERALRICASPQHVLNVLVDRSLVKIEYEFLYIHDQLRDMGRMIAETDEVYKGTRIWRKDMFLLANKIYPKVEGILLNEEILPSPFDIRTNSVHPDIRNLRLLICRALQKLPKGLGNLTSLTHLGLSKCESLTRLPEGLGNLTSLTNLELFECRSLRTLPEGLGNLVFLTNLDLRWCMSLRALPKGLGNLTSLRNLELRECTSLTTLPEGLGNLTSLTNLDLFACTSLITLPEGLRNLTSLTNLDLSDCMSLRALPEGLGNLTSLTNLELRECTSLTTLPEGLGNLTSLTNLDLRYCRSLTTLPKGLGNLTSLTNLDLGYCRNLRTLQEDLGNLTSLRNLELRECTSLTTLPEELGKLTSLTNLDLLACTSLTILLEGLRNLTSLTNLDLRYCKSLKTLPEGLGNLISLAHLGLSKCESLTRLPEGLGNLTSLTNLELFQCRSLRTLPEGLGNLVFLTNLDLRWCMSLRALPEGLGNLIFLKNLELRECTSLTTLPEGLGNLTSLTNLDLLACTSLITLPEGLTNLTSLTNLDLSDCMSLRALPEGLGNLTSLTNLELRECTSLTTLPEGLGNLTSLTNLDLHYCRSLTTLPKGLGNLTSLTNLDLGYCRSLRTLQEDLGNLTSLRNLELRECTSLTTLPEELGKLTSLTNLDLLACTSLTTLPEGLRNLTSLTNLDLRYCKSLRTLPEGLENLISLTNLNLSYCKSLTRLPEGLENLTSLTNLDLSHCTRLTTLPEGLRNLTSLTNLDLVECTSLTILSEGLGKLTSLTKP